MAILPGRFATYDGPSEDRSLPSEVVVLRSLYRYSAELLVSERTHRNLD